MNFAYDYGTSTTNTGRVLARADNLQQEHSAKYPYDSIYRLSQAVSNDASWGAAWTFDTWGNRLTQSPQGLATSKVGTQTLGYTNNRLTSNTYDAAGNQTNDGSHNYTFNAENQITQMDGGAAGYGYDGEGRRMKKTVGSETTYYFYGVGGLLCEFTTTNTGATQAASTNRATYRTSDKLGSAVLILNSSSIVIENNRTLPYGEAWLAENTPSTNDKKFTTYQRDQESGLDYAGARYYENARGRLNSPDQGKVLVFIPTSLNRYTYAGLDPVNISDRTGNDWSGVYFPKPNGPTYTSSPETAEFGEPTVYPLEPPFKKSYGDAKSGCNKTDRQLSADVMNNFSSFADAVVPFAGGLGFASISFRQGNGNTPAKIFKGASIAIDHIIVLNGQVVFTQTTSVTVTEIGMSDVGFTLTVNDLDPLIYPAEITFSFGMGVLDGTRITGASVQLKAEPFGLFSKIGFLTGFADTIEDGVWKHYVSQVMADCNK